MSPEDSLAFGPCPQVEYLDTLPAATVRAGLNLAAESRADGRAAFLRRYLRDRESVPFQCASCGHRWWEPPPSRATLWECPYCRRQVDTSMAQRLCRRLAGLVAALVLSAALVAPQPAQAGDPWTTADTVRQGLFTAALVADWRQSREIARDPNRNDYNPFLRDQDRHTVDRYFLASGIGHYLIARALPRPWREGWQLVWIVAEVGTVHHNVRAGVRLQW